MAVKNLSIDLLRTDGGTQMRDELTQEVFMDYRDKWLAGVEFDPVDVFYDGAAYWLADGFHRFYGAREAKRGSIPCRVHQGTQRDAILFACGANASHGLRRTNADKRRAVEALLSDDEWREKSMAWIAEKCKVSDDLVSSVKRAVCQHSEKDVATLGRDGKKRRPPAKKPSSSVNIKAFNDKFDHGGANEPAGPEHDEPEEELDFEGQVKAANKQIEDFCRSLVKFYEDNCPKLESINYQGRYDSALAHVKACCGTLRTCKYHDKPCPKCSGEGCASCAKESDFGGVTAITYRALAG